MKIYRITRYTPNGTCIWQRLYKHTAGWPGTLSSLVDHGMTGKDWATLEVADVPDNLFTEIRIAEAKVY